MHPRRKPTLVLLATLLVFSFLAIQPSPTTAVAIIAFIVDSTEDLPDFTPGNGHCSANQISDGPCTLRAAITEANSSIHSMHVSILVPPGIYTLSIPSGTVDSPSDGDLDILSNNSTNLIDIISTEDPGDVVITSGPNFQDRLLDIGVANVSISGIVFSGANFAIIPNRDGGGAINNYGTLKLEKTKFTDNTVSCKPGENCTSYVLGGAIRNQGSLTILDSSFIRNSADRGSAIFNASAESLIDISNSTFTQNSNSTIENWSSISILNSTFSDGDTGVFNNGQLFLRSNTLANFSNTIINADDSYVYAANNIFTTQASENFSNLGGNYASGGYNIFSDDSWPSTYSTGDLSNTDPRLGPLDDYGGPTLTHSLLVGSPAINHRLGKCFSDNHQINEDQRHFPRDDGACDTGAFEHSGVFFKMHLPFIRR